jgi:NADH-quinone oxidoreductase subunit K
MFALLPLAAVQPDHVLLLSALLFAIGLLGVTCRRNVLVMLLSVEIMLNAANLALVAFSRVHGDVSGQVMVFFTMTVAAAEVAVGLAIVIAVYRIRQNANADAASDLRETDLEGPPPIVPEGPDTGHGHGHGPEQGGNGNGEGQGQGQGHGAEHAHAGAH